MNQLGTTVREIRPEASGRPIGELVADVIRQDADARQARRTKRLQWRSFVFGFVAALLLHVLYRVLTS